MITKNITYGRLTVLEEQPRAMLLCRCICGTVKSIKRHSLRRGATRSCGCLRRETTAAKATHRLSSTPLYWVWSAMRERCSNPKAINYHNYGGRGIAVCAAWQDAETFLRWAAKDWKAGLQLDRKDNDGPYSPDNCCWRSRKDQCRNQRRTVMINYGGVRISLMEACERAAVPYRRAMARRRRGWSEDKWI